MKEDNISSLQKEAEKLFDEALDGKHPNVVVVRSTDKPECCTRMSEGQPMGDCQCSIMCMCGCCGCNLN